MENRNVNSPIELIRENGMIEGSMLGLPEGPWTQESCGNCGGTVFDQRVMLLKQSAVAIQGDGKEKFAPYPLMSCSQCGWIHGTSVKEKGNPSTADVQEPPSESAPDNIHVFGSPPTLKACDEEGPPPLT